ncbi:MAG: hypothetical protein RBT74_16665 [Tenuifilaceae bacterium]|nr:hypothetical protein [Tenuifilaceae bacterium]
MQEVYAGLYFPGAQRQAHPAFSRKAIQGQQKREELAFPPPTGIAPGETSHFFAPAQELKPSASRKVSGIRTRTGKINTKKKKTPNTQTRYPIKSRTQAQTLTGGVANAG